MGQRFVPESLSPDQELDNQTDTPETQKRLEALSLGFGSNRSRYLAGSKR
jgi:hypothetical protein